MIRRIRYAFWKRFLWRLTTKSGFVYEWLDEDYCPLEPAFDDTSKFLSSGELVCNEFEALPHDDLMNRAGFPTHYMRKIGRRKSGLLHVTGSAYVEHDADGNNVKLVVEPRGLQLHVFTPEEMAIHNAAVRRRWS